MYQQSYISNSRRIQVTHPMQFLGFQILYCIKAAKPSILSEGQGVGLTYAAGTRAGPGGGALQVFVASCKSQLQPAGD